MCVAHFAVDKVGVRLFVSQSQLSYFVLFYSQVHCKSMPLKYEHLRCDDERVSIIFLWRGFSQFSIFSLLLYTYLYLIRLKKFDNLSHQNKTLMLLNINLCRVFCGCSEEIYSQNNVIFLDHFWHSAYRQRTILEKTQTTEFT